MHSFFYYVETDGLLKTEKGGGDCFYWSSWDKTLKTVFCSKVTKCHLQSFIPSRQTNNLSGISDHNGILLEVEWGEICQEPEDERIVPVYHKTHVLGLQAFVWEKFKLLAGNGSCVEGMWESYKDTIFEGIKRYASQKILSKILDP